MSDNRGHGGPIGDEQPDEIGEMLRPEFVVVPDEALVPEANIIRPAPNRFTHELIHDESYFFDREVATDQPDGVLPAGTPVALLVEGDELCRVAVASGLYIGVRRANLRSIDPS
jgi:hypothetical protein